MWMVAELWVVVGACSRDTLNRKCSPFRCRCRNSWPNSILFVGDQKSVVIQIAMWILLTENDVAFCHREGHKHRIGHANILQNARIDAGRLHLRRDNRRTWRPQQQIRNDAIVYDFIHVLRPATGEKSRLIHQLTAGHSPLAHLNWKLTIGNEMLILSRDVFSASSQNLLISVMSPGIRSFSSSVMFCVDFVPSSVFEWGVSLSRQTCFALNGVGSFGFGRWKPKSEWSPPSLLSSLGCCFCKLATIVWIDGNSMEILIEKRRIVINFELGTDCADFACILWALRNRLSVLLRRLLKCHTISNVDFRFVIVFLHFTHKMLQNLLFEFVVASLPDSRLTE